MMLSARTPEYSRLANTVHSLPWNPKEDARQMADGHLGHHPAVQGVLRA